MRLLAILTLCLFLSPAFAHYDEPSPTPVPTTSNTPIGSDHHNSHTVEIGAIIILVAIVWRAVYCYLHDNCKPEEAKPDDKPLAVAPDTEQLKVKLYQ